jgi:hypothetical protein
MPEGPLQVALVTVGGGSVLSSEVRSDGTLPSRLPRVAK